MAAAPELRLKQEMVLGIGGWRLLEALGVQPEVCHLNEGHAAFAMLERAQTVSWRTQDSPSTWRWQRLARAIFSRRIRAVAAGFDRFSPALMEVILRPVRQGDISAYFAARLAGSGARKSDDSSEYFNMAYLAVRGSGAVNGVSRLHGAVSRRIFSPLVSALAADEVPVGHVTNGVHVPTWDSAEADDSLD